MASDKNFGIFFSIIFLVGSLYAWVWMSSQIAMYLLMVALALAVMSIVASHLLNPFNRGWARLGMWLGYVINPLVLSVIFFGIVTPTAALRRCLSKRREVAPQWKSVDAIDDYSSYLRRGF